jgi:TFIIF-interacting CTD phosphatase-like protein
LIQARLYRENCVKLNNNIYAKDLRLIEKDLSKVVLVDNSTFSCLYQLDNSVPMIPYYGGEDNELLSL